MVKAEKAAERLWELEETPGGLLRVWRGPKGTDPRNIVIAMDPGPCDRYVGRLVEQAPEMFELMPVMLGLALDRPPALFEACGLLGGEWVVAFREGGRTAVRALLVDRLKAIKDRVAGGP